MAFIRPKQVHGYTYYQAVRNYRDRDGTHRQQMLCHLGVHNSLEAAIDAERTKVKAHRRDAVLWRMNAKVLRDEILDLHGWEFVDGEFLSREEASQGVGLWGEQWEAYFDPKNHYARKHIDIEEVEILLEMYRACFYYYLIMGQARLEDRRADAHQEKLDKLNQVRREYF